MAWLDTLRWLLSLKVSKFPLKATFDETGITQTTDTGPIHIDWQEVTAIYAYKMDCYSVDQLRIEVLADGRNILCTEDEQSFEDIEQAIATFLPNSLPDWCLRLATSPAFELTWTQVFPLPHVP